MSAISPLSQPLVVVLLPKHHHERRRGRRQQREQRRRQQSSPQQQQQRRRRRRPLAHFHASQSHFGPRLWIVRRRSQGLRPPRLGRQPPPCPRLLYPVHCRECVRQNRVQFAHPNFFRSAPLVLISLLLLASSILVTFLLPPIPQNYHRCNQSQPSISIPGAGQEHW